MKLGSVEARAFTEWNRFGSFAPVRRDTSAVWFVDGRDYMSAVADALENAKQDIFICDWWLSPEIYLKRPIQGEYWRLDNILRRKAVSMRQNSLQAPVIYLRGIAATL